MKVSDLSRIKRLERRRVLRMDYTGRFQPWQRIEGSYVTITHVDAQRRHVQIWPWRHLQAAWFTVTRLGEDGVMHLWGSEEFQVQDYKLVLAPPEEKPAG